MDQVPFALPTPDGLAKAKSYTPPRYCNNKAGSYIDFRAYDPLTGKLRRKRIKLNYIKGAKIRKEYAQEFVKRLSNQLMSGWSPWINKMKEDQQPFIESFEKYEDHIRKMHSNGTFRKLTFVDYISKIKIIKKYVREKGGIAFLYQFDKKFCNEFLDYVYIERNNSVQTRNNYLSFLKTISQWFIERGLMEYNPASGIKPIDSRLIEKNRSCIPIEKVKEIGEWVKANDPHFAFACQILYYCFIRPVEMTRLKIQDFNLKGGTITIPADASKNHTCQTVTIPKKVLLFGVELGVFSAPMGDYVFSIGLKPGKEQIDTKIFRDHWAKVSKALKLKKEWKFYSLKDTGITEMLRQNVAAPVAVKDQARHSSLAITEIYIGENKEAVPEIFNLDGAL